MQGRVLRGNMRPAVCLLALVGATAGAQDFPAGPRPVSAAHALSDSPVIDGNVQGDPAWRGLEAITGFVQTQPAAGQPASQRTEVFVGFTDDAL